MYQATYTPNWGLVAENAVSRIRAKVAVQYKSHYREVHGTVEQRTEGAMLTVGKITRYVTDEEMVELVRDNLPVYLGQDQDGIEVALLDAWLQ
jgi:hypothetical protein